MPSRALPDKDITYPTLKEIGEKWTDVTVQRFKKELKRLKVNDSFNLTNSIKATPKTTGETGLTINFTYSLYGKYVDMGVGRGVAVGTRRTQAFARTRRPDGKLLRYKRRPRKWYSKTIGKEQVILGSIMQKYYAHYALEGIINIPRRVEM